MSPTWILKTFGTSRLEEQQQQNHQNDNAYEDVTSNPHQLDDQQFTPLRCRGTTLWIATLAFIIIFEAILFVVIMSDSKVRNEVAIAGMVVPAITVLGIFIWILIPQRYKAMLKKLLLSSNASYNNHDDDKTRNHDHGNSAYTVSGTVEYDYALVTTPNITQDMQVENGNCHIVEAIEEQIPYEFVFDNNKYEKREITSERENSPIQRYVMVDKVEAGDENPVHHIEISKYRNKKSPIERLKQDSQFNRNPNAGTTVRMNLKEVDLQSVRQQLRSTKSLVLKLSNRDTNSGKGKENMGFVQDADDLYEEVGQPQEHLSNQIQHKEPTLPTLPNTDRNHSIHGNDPKTYLQIKSETPMANHPICEKNVDDSEIQVPMKFVPTGTHQEKYTGSSKEVPGLPVDIRELEGTNKGCSEPIYGNATVADLAISLNEAVENPRPPRIQSRRMTGAETSDSDTNWWTDDEWSA